MKKQELIEKLKQLGVLNIYDNPNGQAVDMVVKSEVLALIDQLDEPKKVVIPRFVAEWLEKRKSMGRNLHSTIVNMDDDELVGDWYYDDNDDPIEEKTIIIARAWLDGYEIEQEKLYTVEIPDPNNKMWVHTILTRQANGKVNIGHSDYSDWRENNFNQLTEAEIKKDFEWAWQWAEEVKE